MDRFDRFLNDCIIEAIKREQDAAANWRDGWQRTSVWWADRWNPRLDDLGMHPDENPFPAIDVFPAAWMRCVRTMLRLTGRR